MKQHQVIIVGGGMVGASVALGLAQLGIRVALLEKKALPTFEPNSPYDVRISAISVASVALLEKLGAWQAIESMRVFPYSGLETWEIEGFQTAFSAEQLGLEKLGFMVENNLIQLGLWQTLNGYSNCTQAVGFSEISAIKVEEQWHVTLDKKTTFSAPLLIACDGANSLVRQWSGIGLTSWQYRQHCLLAVVKTLTSPSAVTWQQFFPTGPRAFLPLAGNNGCVVWYDSPQKIAELQQMDHRKLQTEIVGHFPQRLGEIEVVAHASFSLTRQHAQHYVKNGIVLVGDAAHTINPLAGQGVNLGFKDVKCLLAVIEQAVKKGEDFAQMSVLQQYEKQRRGDNLLMQTGMDIFYKTFKTELFPIKVVRNMALMVAERATPLKKRALKYALGL